MDKFIYYSQYFLNVIHADILESIARHIKELDKYGFIPENWEWDKKKIENLENKIYSLENEFVGFKIETKKITESTIDIVNRIDQNLILFDQKETNLISK